MERWQGKIAVVTGASSGIGWAIAKDLVIAGMKVIGLARRLNQMELLRNQLPINQQNLFQPLQCDLNSLESIKSAFQWIEQKFQRIHVLVNNAGIVKLTNLLEDDNEETLKSVIDINLMGTVYCTKAAFRLMKIALDKNEECHIIGINSLLGHRVPIHIPSCGFNLYPVAKHALRATNEILRRELFEHKLLRLSNLSPGLTETSMGADSTKGLTQQQVPDVGKIMQPEDVSRGLIFILSSPSHVTIAELLMVPSQEKY